MAIDILRENVSIHQTLGDEPNTDNGLSADDLKARFDRGAEIIRDYINETVVHAVNNAENKSETAEAAAAEAKIIAESADQKAAEALQKAEAAEGAAASAAQIASNASSYANSANDKAQQAMATASDAKQVADTALASAEGSTNRAYEALRIANDVAQEMKDYSPSGTRAIAEAAMRTASSRLVAPPSASVGQYFRVAAVDANGIVTAVEAVDAPSGGGGSDSGQNVALTTAQINALDGVFRVCAFVKADVSSEYNAFRVAFNLDGSGGGDTGDNVTNTADLWEVGGIQSNGTPIANSARLRTIATLPDTVKKISVDDGYSYILVVYAEAETAMPTTGTVLFATRGYYNPNGQYGMTSGDNSFLASKGVYYDGELNISEVRANINSIYNNTVGDTAHFRILLKNNDDTTMTADDGLHIHLWG